MGQDNPPQYSDTSSSSHYTPKFSREQTSFLDVVHQFASVKPLGLRIFLNLVQDDDELFSKQFLDATKDAVEEELDGILTNPTFKSIVSAHLAKHDYSAALISISTIAAASLLGHELHNHQDAPDHVSSDTHNSMLSASATDSEQQEKSTPELPDNRPEGQYAPKFTAEQKSFLDVVCRFAAIKSLGLKIFLNLVSDDEELLSKGFPDSSIEGLVAEVEDLPAIPTFKAVLSSYLAKQDYSGLLSSTMTLLAISTPNTNTGKLHRNPHWRPGGRPPSNRPRSVPFASHHLDSELLQHGAPLETLEDPYSQGLYHLYDLLWNQQQYINATHDVTVPNLPYGYINFDQSTPTATLPPIFGMRPESYSYGCLVVPGDSEAIFPANEQCLKKILIRPCYRNILKTLNTDNNHAVILGQPGTGKSCLLAFILSERLRSQQPTLLQLNEDDVYSFTEEGATRFSPKLSIPHSILQNAWLLVDCSENMKVLPQVLSSIHRASSLKIVLAISPKNDRHKAWRAHKVLELWPDICTWEEIYVMGCTGFNEVTIEKGKLAFSYLKYGANPQVCISTASSTHRDVMQLNRIKDELVAHPKSDLLVSAMASHVLHTIVPPLDATSVYTVVPSSPYLAHRLYGGAHSSNYRALFASNQKAIISIPGMFETLALLKLSESPYQNLTIKTQQLSPNTTYATSSFQRCSTFTSLGNLKKQFSSPGIAADTLFIPSCTFPVDAIWLNSSDHIYWLALFSAGVNRVVDGNGMEGLPEFHHGSKYNWQFLLVVPKQCGVTKKIRVDISEADAPSGKVKDLPRYVLKM